MLSIKIRFMFFFQMKTSYGNEDMTIYGQYRDLIFNFANSFQGQDQHIFQLGECTLFCFHHELI